MASQAVEARRGIVKVWITKSVLSAGIYEAEVEDYRPRVDMVTSGQGNAKQFFHGTGKDFHLTKRAAMVYAAEMVRKKIIAIDKQKVRLEKLQQRLIDGKLA
jgi:hypothetical protein